MAKLPKGKRKKKPEVAQRMIDGCYMTPSGDRLYTAIEVELMRMDDRARYTKVATEYVDYVEQLTMKQIMLLNYYVRMHYEGFGREQILEYSQRLAEMQEYIRSNRTDGESGLSYTDMAYVLEDELGVASSIWQIVIDEETKHGSEPNALQGM